MYELLIYLKVTTKINNKLKYPNQLPNANETKYSIYCDRFLKSR
jgi:hypothetical protein